MVIHTTYIIVRILLLLIILVLVTNIIAQQGIKPRGSHATASLQEALTQFVKAAKSLHLRVVEPSMKLPMWIPALLDSSYWQMASVARLHLKTGLLSAQMVMSQPAMENATS